MRQINPDEWSRSVCQLTQEAGLVIMDIYNGATASAALLVAHKPDDDSPLTLADLAAHHSLCQSLQQLTPDIPVVSEEGSMTQGRRSQTGCFWLIDPLDGTKEFLARNGEFTVNVALIVHGKAVWGVVYAPALQQMYWGGETFGAFRQTPEMLQQPIRVSAPVRGAEPCRVVASKSHLNAETTAFIAQLGPVNLIQAGSSLKFCRVAEGSADIYPRLAPTAEWDTAAAQAVLEGAGGCVLDCAGQPLRYGKENILNSFFIASSVPFQKIRQP